MSHGLIVVPRSLRMFNENAAPISLPAQADLGNILKIAAPLVSADSATSASEAAQSDCAFGLVRSQSAQFVRC